MRVFNMGIQKDKNDKISDNLNKIQRYEDFKRKLDDKEEQLNERINRKKSEDPMMKLIKLKNSNNIKKDSEEENVLKNILKGTTTLINKKKEKVYKEVTELKKQLEGLKKPLNNNKHNAEKHILEIVSRKKNFLRHEKWIHPPNRLESHLKLKY